MNRILSWMMVAGPTLVWAWGTGAETWTNLAGHTVDAEVAGVEGNRVRFRNTTGRTWSVPLSSLQPADRQRVRERTGTEPLPSGLKIPLEQAEEDMRRAAQFLRGGKITREAYAARCRSIRVRFTHFSQQAFKDRGEPPDTAQLDRLTRRLEQTELRLAE